MGRQSQRLTPSLSRYLKTMGEQIRLARLRRRYASALVASRANISLPTLRAIEKGQPQVSIGAYAQVLLALGLDKDLARIARDDELGRRLQDQALEVKKRAPKRRAAKTGGEHDER
jgi:transcriptional regulator with XRE-family HTH domain